MANIFDTPTQQNYVETHIPLPLEEMGKLASKWTDNYNAGKSLLGGLDKLAQKIEVSPLDEQRKQDWFQKNNKALNELAQKGVENPGLFADSSFQNEIQQTINQAANDPELRILKSNNEEWIDYSKASAKGTGWDLHFGVEKDARSINGLKQSQRGEIFNPKITKYNNPYKQKSEIMGGINDSGGSNEKDYDYSKMEQTPDGNYNVWRKSTNSWVGVSATRVNQIADLSADIYGNTEDGKWEVQKMLSEELGFGSKAYDFDYNKLQELSTQDKGFAQIFSGIKKRFKNDLVGVATKQIGGISKNTQESKILASPEQQNVYENPEGTAAISGKGIEIPSFTKDKTNTIIGQVGKNSNVDVENIKNLSNLDRKTLLTDYGVDISNDPKNWTDAQREILNNILNEYPEVKSEYKKTGKIPVSYEETIMDNMTAVINKINKPIQRNISSVSLNKDDENYLKNKVGKDIKTVSDLSGINEFYVFNEDQKLVKTTYEKLLKDYSLDEDENAGISKKINPNNLLSNSFGSYQKELVTPYEVSLPNGVKAYIASPGSVKTKNSGYNNKQNFAIQKNTLINTISDLETKLGSVSEFKIGNNTFKAKYEIDDKYHITDNNGKTRLDIPGFNTPEEMIQYVVDIK